MKLSHESLEALKNNLKKALSTYVDNPEAHVTDIYLQPTIGTGTLQIYNDDEEDLGQYEVEEWSDYIAEAFYQNTEEDLREVLNQLKNEGYLETLNILKPYSFVLVDEEKETITELLLMDDDTVIVSHELLEGLDEELDNFLKDLLEK